MRSDYLSRLRDRGPSLRPFSTQIRLARHYCGKYNGRPFERLSDILIQRHDPMPKLLTSTWGGEINGKPHGVAYAGCRYDRQVYRLERGRYWIRSRGNLD